VLFSAYIFDARRTGRAPDSSISLTLLISFDRPGQILADGEPSRSEMGFYASPIDRLSTREASTWSDVYSEVSTEASFGTDRSKL
jgi:hypothetical protein